MSETKSEKTLENGDTVYMRAVVVSERKDRSVLVGVRTDAGAEWTTPCLVDVIAEPSALIDPDALAAEMVRPVAMEREELREERNRLRLDVERLTNELGKSQDRIAIESKLAACTAERDEARAEAERLERHGIGAIGAGLVGVALAERDEARNERDKLKVELACSEDERASLQRQLTHVVKQRDELRDDRSRLFAENKALRDELGTIRFVLNADAEGLSANKAVDKFVSGAARVARECHTATEERDAARAELVTLRADVERLTKERDALCAELTTTRDDLQRTAAAMWEPLRGVAAALGYPRASAPDFGEVDDVGVREWAEVLKDRRFAQQTAALLRERDERARERDALTAERDDWKAEAQRNDELLGRERESFEQLVRKLAIAERVIGRAAIDRAMEVE